MCQGESVSEFNVLLTALGANALVLVVLGFLFKSIITHFLNKDVATFKSTLQLDVTHQIAKYKSELEIERTRLQISYGGIFSKQADVLIKLYELLLELEGEVNGGIVGTEAWNNYKNKLDHYKIYYHENRALIPQALDELALDAMKIGREIMGNSLRDERSTILEVSFRNAKEKCLVEIRTLLAVVPKVT